MSLINKMLKDLETRQNSPQGKPASGPIYQDLHAVSDTSMPRQILPVAMMAVLVLAIGAGVVFWLINTNPSSNLNDAQVIVQTPVAETMSPAPVNPPVIAEQGAELTAVVPVKEKPVVATAAVPVDNTPAITPVPAPVKTTPVKTVAAKPVTRKAAVPAAKSTAQISKPVAVQSTTEIETPAGSIEKKEIPLTPEQIAENTYRVAAQQIQQRHLPDAEKNLRSALASNPRHVAARELLAGLLLLETTGMEPARELLEQGLALMPGQTSFVSLLARIYVEQNTEPKAIALLEQQRNSKPDPDSLALLATLYQRVSRHDEAISAFKDALTLRPQEGKWWLGLGISQEANQNWNEARFAYEQVRVSSIEPRLAQYAEQRLAVVRTK